MLAPYRTRCPAPRRGHPKAAEALRPPALAPVLTAARHATRPVILRVIRPSEQ